MLHRYGLLCPDNTCLKEGMARRVSIEGARTHGGW